MPLEDYARPLAEALGLPEIQVVNNACQFIIGQKLTIVIEVLEDEEAAHFYAGVGQAPPNGAEGFYARLLEAQLFHQEMGERCCFGLDQSSGQVYLNGMFTLSPLGGDEEEFIAALHEFANWAEHWQDALAEDGADSPGQGGSDGELESLHFLRI